MFIKGKLHYPVSETYLLLYFVLLAVLAIICSCLEEASSDGIYCVLRPLEIFPLSIMLVNICIDYVFIKSLAISQVYAMSILTLVTLLGVNVLILFMFGKKSIVNIPFISTFATCYICHVLALH